MFRLFCAAAAAALLTAGCAGTPPTEVAGQQLAAADGNRVVCERERSVGSNRPQKVCMTVAERELLRQRSQTMVRGDNRPVIEHQKGGRGGD